MKVHSFFKPSFLSVYPKPSWRFLDVEEVFI